MKVALEGVIPATVSPCDDNDRFLPDKFAELAGWLYAQGVHGLYVCGGTGDGYKMRLDERKKAVELAIELAAGKGLTIVHVGSSNTRDAMELAEHAAKVKATAIASLPPANCNHSQLVEYYTDIAKASGLPLLVYHYPLLTGRAMSLEEMLQLLEIPGVVGLKLSDCDFFFMKRILLVRPEATIFVGIDDVLCLGLLYGANGGIGTWYNLFPRLFLGIYESVRKSDLPRAMELQNIEMEFSALAWSTPRAPGVFEFLMKQKGFPQVFRRPRPSVNRQIIEKIKPELDRRMAAIEQAR